jgi:hypothetical protein
MNSLIHTPSRRFQLVSSGSFGKQLQRIIVRQTSREGGKELW